MILVKCYIAGFGRLIDKTFTFGPGLNEILEDNGWGKTTFAVFIKAMFYGMEYAPRRSGLTEREHYRPWETASYGGTLDFSIGEKKYRIERQFGHSNKEDEFAVYDAATMLPVDDFSENIGEEIFEVDRESFEKSIFVPQGSLETEITSRLNAKLGGLGAVQDDMNRFDVAVQAIDDARKKYTATGKVNPGRIKVLNDQIKSQKEKSDQISTLQNAYDAKSQMLLDKRAELRKLEFKKSQMADSLASIARSEKSVGAYQAKKDTLDRQEEILKGLDDFFAGGLPEDQEIDEWEAREREIELEKNHRDLLREKIPDMDERELLSRLFTDNPISKNDLDNWKQQASEIKSIRMKGEHVQMSEEEKTQLADLREFFKGGEPADEEMQKELSDISRLNEISGQIKSLNDTYRKRKKAVKNTLQLHQMENSVIGTVILGIIAAVFLLAGFVFIKISEDGILAQVIGFGSFVAGAAFLIIFVTQILRRQHNKSRYLSSAEGEIVESERNLGELNDEYNALDASINDFIKKYPVEAEDRQQAILEIHRKKDRFDTLSAEEQKYNENTSGMMEDLSSLQLSLFTAMDKYAKIFNIDLYEEDNVGDLISKLEEKYDEYQEYEKNEQEYQRIVASINRMTKGLLSVLKTFPLKSDISDLAACIREIRANALLYAQTQKQVDEIRGELKSFHVEELAGNGKTLQDLQYEQKQLDEQISQQKQYIADDAKELENRSAELLECEEARENLKELNAKKSDYEGKVKLLEDTKKYLSLAKEKFLQVYMEPLRNRLNYYLKSIYPDTDEAILTDDFELDMNLSVSVTGKSGGGKTRSIDYLSTGYQDLASFCSRAALIDVLFRREQPMIILDDPFVNFDAEKISDARRMMQTLSEKYQIIYFTCHGSRTMK